MKAAHLLLTTVAAFAAGAVAHASDPMALYARIDKVVFEPATGAPDAIQIWGVFSLAKPDDRNDYLPPARGYLYFKLAADADAARKEWSDLKASAGTGEIVSLGSRYELHARLRHADERPANPDPYIVSMGLQRMRGRTTYPPVRALIEYRQ